MEGGRAQPSETGSDPGSRNSCSDTLGLWAFSAGGWAEQAEEESILFLSQENKPKHSQKAFLSPPLQGIYGTEVLQGTAEQPDNSTERKLSTTSPDSVTHGNPLIPLFFLQMKSFHPVNSIPNSHSGRNHLPQWKIWNSSNVCCILLLFVRTCSAVLDSCEEEFKTTKNCSTLDDQLGNTQKTPIFWLLDLSEGRWLQTHLS